MLMPTRPVKSGHPCPVICVHVLPASVDLKSPPPGPLLGRYTIDGGRRVLQKVARIVLLSVGSIAMSMAPMSGDLYSVLYHVAPPSRETKTPRISFGPY